MKRDLALGVIKDHISHFWAGSLDVHNMTNEDYIASHPSIVDFAWSEVDNEAFLSIKYELLKKYNCKIIKRSVVGEADLVKKFWADYENEKIKLTCKLFKDCMLFTKPQVNCIFNIVWLIVGDIAKENNIAFPGFRFAINGGKSVNSRSVSVCTLHFLYKRRDESFEDMIKRCCSSFLHYVYWQKNGSRYKWDDFLAWRNEQVAKKICGKFNFVNEFFTKLI